MRATIEADGQDRRDVAVAPRDRRRRQASWAEAGDRFRTSFVDSPLGLALLSPNGEIFQANPAVCRLLGIEEGELCGSLLLDLVVAEDLPLAEPVLEVAAADVGQLRSCSVRLTARDGAWRWVDLVVRMQPARDGAPLFAVVHVEDRTAEVEAMTALGHAERVVLAGRLASGVMHDVRNGLASLQGRAELLAADLSDAESARSHLDSMQSAMDRMASLTGRVLGLAKPVDPGRELVDLSGIVTAFAPVARAQFVDQDRVEVDARQPVLLHADPAEVERILLTLFDNAVHAVADGGCIRIAVSTARRGGAGGAGLLGRLVVEDTGAGMDEETAAWAFEPFFTTKGERGTGLGLASASAVVDELGGTITIDSAPGRGTRVEVLLPAIEPGATGDA